MGRTRVRGSAAVSRSVLAERSLRPHQGGLAEFDVGVDVDVRERLCLVLDLAWTSAGRLGPCGVQSLKVVLSSEQADRLAGLLAGRAAQLRRSAG